MHEQRECWKSTESRRKTYGRATEPKCKLMLAKSPKSAHKKLELIAPVFFELTCQ